MVQLILAVQHIGEMSTYVNGIYGKNIGANVTIGVGCMLVQFVLKLHWRYNWHFLCNFAILLWHNWLNWLCSIGCSNRTIGCAALKHWYNWLSWLCSIGCSIGTIGTRIAGRQEAIGPGPTFWLQRQPPLHQ